MKINWDSQRPEKLCTMYYILPAHPISWFPILGISLLLIKEAEEESWIHRQLYGNFLPHPTMTRITKHCPKHIRLFFHKILIPQLLYLIQWFQMDSRGFSACWIKAVESKIIQNCMFMKACSDIELVLKRVQRYIIWWVNQLHGKIKLCNKEIEINIENLRRQKSTPYF